MQTIKQHEDDEGKRYQRYTYIYREGEERERCRGGVPAGILSRIRVMRGKLSPQHRGKICILYHAIYSIVCYVGCSTFYACRLSICIISGQEQIQRGVLRNE